MTILLARNMCPGFGKTVGLPLVPAVNEEMQSQGGDLLNSYLKISVMVAAMALLIPTGAIAKRPEDKPAKDEKHAKFESPDATSENPDATSDNPDATFKNPAKAKTPNAKLATANVKGVVTVNDGTTLTLTVNKASGHLKGCKGQTLSFDVSGLQFETRFFTADNEPDGDMDALDVLVGHAVKVRAKVPRTKGKKTSCSVSEETVLPAKAVHNRTTPKPDDEVEETATETETETETATEIEEPVVEDPELDEGDEDSLEEETEEV